MRRERTIVAVPHVERGAHGYRNTTDQLVRLLMFSEMDGPDISVKANFDEGAMWPTSFALKELTAAEEARIGGLVKKALPDPAAVLVDVELTNITFVDTQIRAGRPPHPAMSAPLPAVLGNGVGGVVAAVGQGVDAAQVGRRVITSLRGTGGDAERAVAPADALIDVPDDVTLPDAVALRPTIGQTIPLERACDAHAAVEARTTLGRILLVVR